MLTYEQANEYLSHDSKTGVLVWKKDINKQKAGNIAGYVCKHNGYVIVYLLGKIHKAHRIAWLLNYGEYPKNQIDHINGIKHDNRLCNLREATNQQNCFNLRDKRSHNSTGYLGVSFARGCFKPYKAKIVLNGKQKHLGCYETAELAHEAYLKAKRDLHEFCTI